MTNPSQPQRWWLNLNGQVDGPRSQAYVAVALQNGQLTPMTPACPVGGNQWQPLQIWPEFQPQQQSAAPPVPPPPVPPPPPISAANPFAFDQYPTAGQRPVTATNDRLVTNARLPAMANAMCVYTLVLAPIYWGIGFVSTFSVLNQPHPSDADLTFFLFDLFVEAPVSLAVTVTLFLAGLRLRNLRGSSIRWLKIGLWGNLVWVVVRVLLLVFITAVIGANGGFEDDSSSGDMGSSILLLLCGGAGVIFEIATLVWLSGNAASLPLNRSR